MKGENGSRSCEVSGHSLTRWVASADGEPPYSLHPAIAQRLEERRLHRSEWIELASRRTASAFELHEDFYDELGYCLSRRHLVRRVPRASTCQDLTKLAVAWFAEHPSIDFGSQIARFEPELVGRQLECASRTHVISSIADDSVNACFARLVGSNVGGLAHRQFEWTVSSGEVLHLMELCVACLDGPDRVRAWSRILDRCKTAFLFGVAVAVTGVRPPPTKAEVVGVLEAVVERAHERDGGKAISIIALERLDQVERRQFLSSPATARRLVDAIGTDLRSDWAAIGQCVATTIASWRDLVAFGRASACAEIAVAALASSTLPPDHWRSGVKMVRLLGHGERIEDSIHRLVDETGLPKGRASAVAQAVVSSTEDYAD